MPLQPIVIKRFFNTRQNRFCSPGVSLARCTNWDSIPLGSYVVWQVQACKRYDFDLDSNGNVPTEFQDANVFLGATGTPTFGVKTRTDALTADTSFAAYANGYNATYTDLTKGWAAVGAIFPLTTIPAQDYLAQLTLRGALQTPMIALPHSWLPINLEYPIVTGEETGGVPSPAAYSGTAEIPEGSDYLDITVPGLMTSGVLASLTQQNNGNGQTLLWETITANNLRINAGQVAPAGGWKFYWALDSLSS